MKEKKKKNSKRRAGKLEKNEKIRKNQPFEEKMGG